MSEHPLTPTPPADRRDNLQKFMETRAEKFSLSDYESDPNYAAWKGQLKNSIKSRPRSIYELRKLFSKPQVVDAAVSALLREGAIEDVDDGKGGTIYKTK